MKYICVQCGFKFNEPDKNKEVQNSLVRSLILSCPICNSYAVVLTEKGRLLIERKAKINKINNQ